MSEAVALTDHAPDFIRMICEVDPRHLMIPFPQEPSSNIQPKNGRARPVASPRTNGAKAGGARHDPSGRSSNGGLSLGGDLG